MPQCDLRHSPTRSACRGRHTVPCDGSDLARLFHVRVACLYAAGMASQDEPGGAENARRAESMLTHAEGSISEDAVLAAARERPRTAGAVR